jgi:hypothetical protein
LYTSPLLPVIRIITNVVPIFLLFKLLVDCLLMALYAFSRQRLKNFSPLQINERFKKSFLKTSTVIKEAI